MTSRLARPFIVAFFVSLMAVFSTAGSAEAAAAALPPPTDNGFGGARIMWLMNEERRFRGMAPVARNANADALAQYWSNLQAWFGGLGHNSNLNRDVTDRVTRSWRFVAENVGCGASADHLHGMWMRSGNHVRNILNSGVDTVGVGYTYARGCAWATVVFIDT